MYVDIYLQSHIYIYIYILFSYSILVNDFACDLIFFIQCYVLIIYQYWYFVMNKVIYLFIYKISIFHDFP